MELALIIYLINLFDGIGAGLTYTVVGLLGLCGVSCGIMADESKRDSEKSLQWAVRGWKFAKAALISLPILTIFVWMIPNKETSYAMLAAYGVQTVAEMDEVRQFAGKSIQVLENYMDNYLEDFKPEESE